MVVAWLFEFPVVGNLCTKGRRQPSVSMSINVARQWWGGWYVECCVLRTAMYCCVLCAVLYAVCCILYTAIYCTLDAGADHTFKHHVTRILRKLWMRKRSHSCWIRYFTEILATYIMSEFSSDVLCNVLIHTCVNDKDSVFSLVSNDFTFWGSIYNVVNLCSWGILQNETLISSKSQSSNRSHLLLFSVVYCVFVIFHMCASWVSEITKQTRKAICEDTASTDSQVGFGGKIEYKPRPETLENNMLMCTHGRYRGVSHSQGETGRVPVRWLRIQSIFTAARKQIAGWLDSDNRIMQRSCILTSQISISISGHNCTVIIRRTTYCTTNAVTFSTHLLQYLQKKICSCAPWRVTKTSTTTSSGHSIRN